MDGLDISRRRALKVAAAGTAAAWLPVGLAHAQLADPRAAATVEGWTSHSPFLTRAFAPVFDERDDLALVVEGELPRGLDGMFVRNGPNPMFAPDANYAYPFDGTGMLHAIVIRDGKAAYRNRWVATTEFRQERAAGKRLFNSSFGPAPHANLSNTNLLRHAGRYLSLFEGGIPYEVDAGLATRGAFDYDGRLSSYMSAHPKADPRSGEMLAVAYDMQKSRLTYIRVAADGTLDRSVDIESPWPAMVHDIAITRSFVIACIAPFVFDFKRQGPPATWQPERGTRILLIPRDARSAGEARWIACAPFFNFHTVNAYEEGGSIALALPWYDAYTLAHDRPIRLELHRLDIDLASARVTDTRLDDRPCEFGRVNERMLGARARFGYLGLRDPRPGETPQVGSFEAFVRYDLDTGQNVVHRFAQGETVCEPVFVAAPGASGEDQGFVMSFVHEEGNPGGSFVLLDARNFAGAPVARIRLPRRVPAGLHGSWIAAT